MPCIEELGRKMRRRGRGGDAFPQSGEDLIATPPEPSTTNYPRKNEWQACLETQDSESRVRILAREYASPGAIHPISKPCRVHLTLTR
jgi:hypothetical protein